MKIEVAWPWRSTDALKAAYATARRHATEKQVATRRATDAQILARSWHSDKANEPIAHHAENDKRSRDRQRHADAGAGHDTHVNAQPERRHCDRRQQRRNARDRGQQALRNQTQRPDDQNNQKADDEPGNKFA